MSNVLIVLNYNDFETTQEFIENIKEYEEIDKIVVVDNCSPDNSFEKLIKYRNDKIHVIKSEKNGGYGYGNNYGIKYAIQNFNPKFITTSNPDIKFKDNSLKKLKSIFDKNKNIAAVNMTIKNIDGRIENSGWNLPNLKDDIQDMFLIWRKIFSKSKEIYSKKTEELEFYQVLHGCFFMIKSNVIQDIGMFDERTFLFGEERILGFKIKSINKIQATLLTEQCIHEHSKSINKNISSVINQYKILYNSRLIYYKYYKKINKFQIMFLKMIMQLSLIEKKIIFFIKGIFKDE